MSCIQTQSLIYECRATDSDIHIIMKVSPSKQLHGKDTDTPDNNFAAEHITNRVVGDIVHP